MADSIVFAGENPFVLPLMHLGFAIGALAYLLHDILWLRVVALISYGIFLAAVVWFSNSVPLDFVPWYCLFVIINLSHSGWLVYQRQLWRLTEKEKELHKLAFSALRRHDAKRLMHQGKWIDAKSSVVLTEEGKVSSKIYLVAAGEVAVRKAGRHVLKLEPGQFVGEIGFMARRPASATAIALGDIQTCEPTRLIGWDVEKLRRRCQRDPSFAAALNSALGSDVARKIASHNMQVQRV